MLAHIGSTDPGFDLDEIPDRVWNDAFKHAELVARERALMEEAEDEQDAQEKFEKGIRYKV